LYQGSPRVLAVSSEGFIRGHCAPTVAYVINNRVAELLLRFYDYEMSRYNASAYFNWEAHLQWWLMGQGAEAYIPLRHYGEHGGLPNPEHGRYGQIFRAGVHRADSLTGQLSFLPQYAGGSRIRYLVERFKARILGCGRLLSGRWIVRTNVYELSLRTKFKMYMIGAKRLIIV
jgi:hypothetical protein